MVLSFSLARSISTSISLSLSFSLPLSLSVPLFFKIRSCVLSHVVELYIKVMINNVNVKGRIIIYGAALK